jgi:hypothetical protein
MRAALICSIFLGMLAGGCSSLIGPGEAARLMVDDPAAEFSAWLVQPGPDPIPELRVDGAVGAISFQGAIGTPYPCYDVAGYVDRRRSQLHLEIVATSRSVACIAVVATFGYSGVVAGLPPGSYDVRVTHRVDNHRMQVMETTVTVR